MNTNLLDLSGKVAIVTGGGRGIGLGIARRLAQAGANVVIANRNAQEGEEAVAQIGSTGGWAVSISTDVAQEDSVAYLMNETMSRLGGLDILVNNAGIFPNVPVLNMSVTDFHQVIDVNLRGVYLCTKLAALKMIELGRGGKIINITSIDALHPSMVGLAHYDASKHGVWGFTKNVALELAPHKIWVNAIAPGGVITPGVQQSGIDPAMLEAFANQIPMKRMGDPDDIGKVALFLASDMSSYMTGEQIVVDGGMLLT